MSIIVPVLNESDNLKPFVESLLAVMRQEDYRFELVFVNDGSTAASAEKLDAIAKRKPQCNVVHFQCNYDQTAAMMAGLDYSKSDVVIPIYVFGGEDLPRQTDDRY